MALEKIVRADECAIGSTLTRDVHDDAGAPICSAGDRLSGRLVIKLKRAGITSVYVKRELTLGRTHGVNGRLSRLDKKFARVSSDPIMDALKRAVAEKIQEKSRGGS
jgi:hypothetical protein